MLKCLNMLTESSFDLLWQRLQSFSEMSAFDLLSDAACRDYFGGTSEALSGLTVSEFSLLSATELAQLKLLESDVETIIRQIELILPDLKNEVEPSSVSHEQPLASDASAETIAEKLPPELSASISSVAQEQILTQILLDLAAWPALSSVGHVTLGEVWTDSDTRAPFEEMITLKQLAKLSARSLLAKRSMTAEKIVAITNAVRRAMKQFDHGYTAEKAALQARLLPA